MNLKSYTNFKPINVKTNNVDLSYPKTMANPFSHNPDNTYVEKIDIDIDENKKIEGSKLCIRENSKSIYNSSLLRSGYYGGSQENISSRQDYLNDENVRTIVSNYYNNFTKEDLELLFYRMTSVGCGYMAAVNTLMDEFCGNEAFFKEHMGFDYAQDYNIVFDLNGQSMEVRSINYDYAFLDFFLYYNKNYIGFKNIQDVYGNTAEQIKYETGDLALSNQEFELIGADGTYSDATAKVFAKYLNDKGIKLKVYSRDIKNDQTSGYIDDNYFSRLTPEIINNVNSKSQKILISSDEFNIYSMNDLDGNGKLDDVVYENVGAHGMMVTGYSDGKICVSSWGNEYLVDFGGTYDYSIYDYNDNYDSKYIRPNIVYDEVKELK